MLPNMVAEHCEGPLGTLALVALCVMFCNGRLAANPMETLEHQALQFAFDGPQGNIMDDKVNETEMVYHDVDYDIVNFRDSHFNLDYLDTNFLEGWSTTSLTMSWRRSKLWIGAMARRARSWMESTMVMEDWSLHRDRAGQQEDWCLLAEKERKWNFLSSNTTEDWCLQGELEDWDLQSYEMNYDMGMVYEEKYDITEIGNFSSEFLENYFKTMIMESLMTECGYILKNDLVKWILALCLLTAMVAHRACEKRGKKQRMKKLRHLGLG